MKSATESTGKTTLTETLASHFNCTKVFEAGRDIIANSNSFSINDLQFVATEHANRIHLAITGNSPLIIIDTDIYTTMSYCRHFFQEELDISEPVRRANTADLYLYLNNDVPFFQDGTRLDEAERDLLDLSHRQVLRDNNIEPIEISGNWEERYTKALAAVEKLVLATIPAEQ